MNRIKFLIAGIFLMLNTLIAFAQSDNKLVVREINYGESRTHKIEETKMKNSPSGHINVAASELAILNKTDTIKAVLGAEFAVEYELKSAVSEITTIEITWVFPDGMKDMKGKPMKKFSYDAEKETNSPTYSYYLLETENELVKGEWIFILSKDGKELYRRSFHLI